MNIRLDCVTHAHLVFPLCLEKGMQFCVTRMRCVTKGSSKANCRTMHCGYRKRVHIASILCVMSFLTIVRMPLCTFMLLKTSRYMITHAFGRPASEEGASADKSNMKWRKTSEMVKEQSHALGKIQSRKEDRNSDVLTHWLTLRRRREERRRQVNYIEY